MPGVEVCPQDNDIRDATITRHSQRTPVGRRAERAYVSVSATCRTATGRSGQVVITDLSAYGCCVFRSAVAMSEGLRIMLKPEGLGPIAGIVRWSARGDAGIEFENPLYGPVAEHLQRVHRAARSDQR